MDATCVKCGTNCHVDRWGRWPMMRQHCWQCRVLSLPVEQRYRCRECDVWCVAAGAVVYDGSLPLLGRHMTGHEAEPARAHGDVCQFCDWWLDDVERSDEPGVVRINGTQYGVDVVNPWRDVRDKSVLGFGGAVHVIKWNDGRVTRTNNLWCRGEIPAHFRERLPDNATFDHSKR